MQKIDSESRAKNVKERIPVNNPDDINSWLDLQGFCKSLTSISCVTKDEQIILCEIIGSPPMIQYSIIIYTDFSICAFYGFSKIYLNDLINGFTHKVEKYTQILNIIERTKSGD